MAEDLSRLQIVLLIILLALNLYTLLLFYIDKKRAVNQHRNRIPEKKLLQSSFIFGGIGAYLGMSAFRHKTKHMRFKILVPIAAILTGFVAYIIINI